MYNFIDVSGVQSGSALPSEALQINGDYIENQIMGYRTLYVSGREALAPTLETKETQGRDGVRLTDRRFPARTITVGYQLVAANSEAFRAAYNELGALLNVPDSELIFADESDKYFTGTLSEMGEVETGRNAVTGEFTFTCLDPFKYSVKEYEVSPSADGGKTFIIDYNGTYRAFPTFEADFYTDESATANNNGRCGYVAFFDENEHILQFGDPAELSEEAVQVVKTDTVTNTTTYSVPTTKVLLNHDFKSASGWNNVKNQYAINGGVTYSCGTKQGTIGGGYSTENNSNGVYYLTDLQTWGDDNGTWRGPTATYTLSAASTDFDFSYSLKFAISSGDNQQQGLFEVMLTDANNKIVCGAQAFKTASGTKGYLRFIVDSKKQAQPEIDLSFHNKYFGANRSANKKKGVTEIKTKKTCTISKSGNTVKFNLGGLEKTFTVSGLSSRAVTKITVCFACKGNKDQIYYNGLFWMKFIRNYNETKTTTSTTTKQDIITEYHNVQNKFNANDVLTADSSSGSVQLNNLNRPDLGALGNDWETMCLEPRVNQIKTAYSDWVSDAYKPTFKIRYREVFL